VYSPSEFLRKINKKNYEILNNYSSLIIQENVFSNLCLECPPNREILKTLNTDSVLCPCSTKFLLFGDVADLGLKT
jgi:hypothetical protein